jgi:hypothetical protein
MGSVSRTWNVSAAAWWNTFRICRPNGAKYMAASEMTNFDEEYEAAEARMTELRNEGHAVVARYDQDRGCVVVTLNTGLELVFPADAAEGLAGAQTDQLSDIEITGAGLGLHWPQLDADLYVPALLQGVFASKRSMAAELGAVGGRVSTPAKVAAACRRQEV